jgi:hypothetical protein
MNKITLDEGLRLLEQKKKRITELRALRSNSAVVKYEEGDDESFRNVPERKVDDITNELNFTERQVRKLQLAITKANVEVETDIEVEGEKLKLGEVIVAIRQFRDEHPYLTSLSNNKNEKKKVKDKEYIDGSLTFVTKVHITEVQFNTAQYREKSALYEKLIQKMQSTINKLNTDVVIDFVNEEYQPEQSE